MPASPPRGAATATKGASRATGEYAITQSIEQRSGAVRKPIEARRSPLSDAVEQIGDGWMLMILWSSFEGISRFDDYQRTLGVARNILSNRLRRLVEMGVLEKRPVREGARRLEYRITAKGAELRAPLEEIRAWGDRWNAPAGREIAAAE
jgi:DNA-binding HxlR family transcriptional regulator